MRKYFFIIVIILNGMMTLAQVHVRDEPRHHNVFENEFVRILDVYLAPGDTTQYHLHNTPSVFTHLTSTTTGSQLQGQSSASSSTSVANTARYDSLVTQRIHRVWNEDNHWFHVMDIELTGGKPRSNPPLLHDTSLNLLFNKTLVNGYRLQLKPSMKFSLPVSALGYLLVSFGNANLIYKSGKVLQHRKMKSGHYLWVDSGNSVTLSVNDEASSDFLLLQMK